MPQSKNREQSSSGAEDQPAGTGSSCQSKHLEARVRQLEDRIRLLDDGLTKSNNLCLELIHANAGLADQTMDKIMEEIDKQNAPSARELDHLWKEILLARKPDYGDWDYPAMAARHILAEIKEILTEQIKAWKVKDEPVPGKKLSDDPCKLYEETP